ncbi:MAG: PIG-L deacetylase family protein [Geminicoccaceae bacterium]
MTLFARGVGSPINVLCLGAHADDIEIGAGGTLLTLIERKQVSNLTWVVACAQDERRTEAERSARTIAGDTPLLCHFGEFPDSYLPYRAHDLKDWLRSVALQCRPDVIFTHYDDDRHQDHRVISRLTWNIFRGPQILEYEIPKWDGDLSRPNGYVPLSEAILDRKLKLLHECFHSQAVKPWFDKRTFAGLARLRGLECHADEGYAEAFHIRKIKLV